MKQNGLPVRSLGLQRGLALIELMIALVLGIVIIGAVAGIMLSNTQSFRTTRGLAQIQDSVRVGYELLARDIRQAGNVPCGNDIEIVNILNPAQGSNTPWQYDWGNGILGLAEDDALAGVENRIEGTQALIIMSGEADGTYIENYDISNNSANFTVATASGANHSLRNGDILLVCNEDQGTIFQMSQGQNNNADKIVVNTGNSQSPGNCTKGLGPLILTGNANNPCNTNGNPGPYAKNSVIARLSSVAWYIGGNDRDAEGGRSLYMARLASSGGSAVLNEIEIASGVVDMQLRYRLVDTAEFVEADSVANWKEVNAVEVTLELESQDRNISTDASENDGRIGRSFTSVVAIRNRSL